MKKYLPPGVVAVASAITHLIYFGYPAQVVFDETFATNFLDSYAKGAFYFDVHPPLAKLIVYFFGFLTGASYQGNTGSIGDALPHSIVLLRLVPIICGFLLPLVIYAITRNIGLSPMASMVAGLLVVFENSLVVQSRFILFDIMLVLFGFTSVFLYQEYRKRVVKGKKPAEKISIQNIFSSKNLFLFGSTIFASAAFSIKWTGMAFPLMIVILELIALYKSWGIACFWKRLCATIRAAIPFIFIYLCVGIIAYTSIFAVHFYMLPNPGTGDVFVSPQFQNENFFAKLINLNIEMYKANAYQIPPHQYQSAWWTWPLMLRPIFYWQGQDAYIYLLGNPFIYWLGAAAMITVLGYVLLKRNTKYVANRFDKRKAAIFIAIGFLVNYAPFIFITRPMFLYHYESALIMSIMAIAWIVDSINFQKWRVGVSATILILCISGFIYFSPLTYGMHLDLVQLQARMWLPGWR